MDAKGISKRYQNPLVAVECGDKKGELLGGHVDFSPGRNGRQNVLIACKHGSVVFASAFEASGGKAKKWQTNIKASDGTISVGVWLRNQCRLHGENLVNKRVEVFWPIEDMWYRGTVTSWIDEKALHVVKYDGRGKEHLMWALEMTRTLQDGAPRHAEGIPFVQHAQTATAAAPAALNQLHAVAGGSAQAGEQRMKALACALAGLEVSPTRAQLSAAERQQVQMSLGPDGSHTRDAVSQLIRLGQPQAPPAVPPAEEASSVGASGLASRGISGAASSGSVAGAASADRLGDAAGADWAAGAVSADRAAGAASGSGAASSAVSLNTEPMVAHLQEVDAEVRRKKERVRELRGVHQQLQELKGDEDELAAELAELAAAGDAEALVQQTEAEVQRLQELVEQLQAAERHAVQSGALAAFEQAVGLLAEHAGVGLAPAPPQEGVDESG